MRGAAGSRARPGPTAGASARSPGTARAKRRRAPGAVGLGAVDFVVMLNGPKAQRFSPKTSAGARWGARPCPRVGPVRGTSAGTFPPVSLLLCRARGQVPGFGFAWAGRCGGPSWCVCVYPCVCLCVCVCARRVPPSLQPPHPREGREGGDGRGGLRRLASLWQPQSLCQRQGGH